jgi:hypothetical protein
MAFCTTCGAQVSGAFCNHCGTQVGTSGGQTPPMQAAPAALPRKTSPLIWILIIVLGIFVLGFVGVVGTGFFIARKISRNPAAAAARLAALANKNVDVVSEDDDAGTITLRDRRTGKTVTMTFDQAKGGRFSLSAEGDDGKTATMEFGASSGTLPSWVPAYPGSSPQFNITARGDTNDGAGEGGNFTFTTSDPSSRVLSFYQDKARDMGMKVNLTSTTADAGMVIASDEASHRSLTAIVGSDSGKTTVNVTYGAKR